MITEDLIRLDSKTETVELPNWTSTCMSITVGNHKIVWVDIVRKNTAYNVSTGWQKLADDIIPEDLEPVEYIVGTCTPFADIKFQLSRDKELYINNNTGNTYSINVNTHIQFTFITPVSNH